MNEMAKPTLNHVTYSGMKMTTAGLEPGGTISKDGILAHLLALNFFQASVNWCVGDLILAGESAFGEHWMTQAVADHLSSMSPDTQKQCQWVSQRYPHAKRVNRLTWTHHLVAAGMDDETERTLLLESCLSPSEDAPGRSEDQPMGVAELRRAVRATRTDAEEDGEDEARKMLAAAMRAVLRLTEDQRAAVLMWLKLGCPDEV